MQQFNVKNVALMAISVGALLVFLFVAYNSLKSFSYRKIQPLSVTIEVRSSIDTGLQLQYDYGYGFNAQHEQGLPVSASPEAQKISANISRWKRLVKLRLIAPDNPAIEPISVELNSADNTVRVLRDWEVTQLGQTMVIPDLTDFLSDSLF